MKGLPTAPPATAPRGPPNIIPAIDHGFSHDGDPRLAAHIAHCVAKSTTLGDLVSKDKRNSPRKIDAAVAAIVALDRAAFHTTKKKARARSFAA